MYWLIIDLCLLIQNQNYPALTADQIATKAYQMMYTQGSDRMVHGTITVKNRHGQIKKREFTSLRRTIENGLEGKHYLYFHKPSEFRGMAFLVWKHQTGDDDRWLYLPAIKAVRRLAAKDERTTVVGSDFFWEDLIGRLPSEDQHKLVETTDNYFVIESRPRIKNLVEFDKYVSWIHQQTFIPVNIKYMRSDTIQRIIRVVEVKTIQGYITATSIEVNDVQRGTNSTLKNNIVLYDRELSDEIFNERYLREPPREVLEGH